MSKIIVVSGQSGAGKGTLLTKLRSKHPDKFYYVRSTTSRPPRTEGEPEAIALDKRNYIFVSKEDFKKKIEQGDMLEWAEVHGNYYGKSKAEFAQAEKAGKIPLVEIDVHGMRAVKKAFGNQVTTIFIVVPSLAELNKRLAKRGSETPAQIATRLETARKEATYIPEYDHKVVNDEIDQAVTELEDIIFNQ